MFYRHNKFFHEKDNILQIRTFLPMSYTVIYEGKEISLAPREFEVLYLLAQRPNWVIPKKNIYCSVWGSNYYDDQIPYKTVEHVVWKIRKKMGYDIIETLINVGYRLKKM